MTVQPSAAIGDNSEKKFKDYNDVLSDIQASIKAAAKFEQKSDEAIYEALGKVLELGRTFQSLADDNVALKEYLQYKEVPSTAKSDGNFFHGIVTAAFAVIDPNTNLSMTAAPQLSKYRMILKYAFRQKMTADQLVAALSSSSIKGLYERAFCPAQP